VAGRGGVALLVFSKNFDKMSLRNVADFSFKKGSRISKQSAPKPKIPVLVGNFWFGCLYFTKLAPISKIAERNDVARAERVVKRN
jgi:hypothetical protein